MNKSEFSEFIKTIDNDTLRKILLKFPSDLTSLKSKLYRRQSAEYFDSVESMAKSGNINIIQAPFASEFKFYNGDTIYHYLAYSTKDVKKIIDKEEFLFKTNDDNDTPLHILASLGNKSVLNIKATFELKNKDGNTPYHLYASKCNNINDLIVDNITKNIANVIKNNNKETPLFLYIKDKFKNESISSRDFSYLVRYEYINSSRFTDKRIAISHMIFSLLYDNPKKVINYMFLAKFSNREYSVTDSEGNLPIHYIAAAIVKEYGIGSKYVDDFKRFKEEPKNNLNITPYDIMTKEDALFSCTLLKDAVFERKI